MDLPTKRRRFPIDDTPDFVLLRSEKVREENERERQNMTEQGKKNFIAILPSDLVLEVFLKLPVKYLLRIKSVCKLWNSITSQPKFVRMHLDRLREDFDKHQKLLYVPSNRRGSPSFRTIYFEEPHDKSILPSFPLEAPYGVKILGSCNGLVFATCFERVAIFDGLVVWNPLTGLYKKFPMPKGFKRDVAPGFRHYFAFCHDVSTDDYKVVHICPRSQDQVDIFSLKSNTWRSLGRIKTDNIYYDDNYLFSNPGVIVDDTVYWLVERDNPNLILGFSIKDEKWNELPLPFNLIRNDHPPLKVLQGSLHVLSVTECTINMWRMKETKDWIQLPSIRYPDYFINDNFEVLHIMKDGKIIILFSRLPAVRTLATYDPAEGEVESIMEDRIQVYIDGGDQSGLKGEGNCTTYIESLVSP